MTGHDHAAARLGGLLPAAALAVMLPWIEAAGNAAVSVWLDMAAHLLVFAVLAAVAWTGLRPTGRWVGVWLPAMVLMMLAAARAPYGFAAGLRLFEMAAALSLALFLAAILPHHTGERPWLARALLLSAALASLAALAARLAGADRGAAGFVNPNHLGAFLVAVLPLSLALASRPVWLRPALAAVLCAGILATGSRGAILAILLVGGLALAVTARGRVRRRLVRGMAVSLLLFALLATAVFWGRFAGDADVYRYDRLRIWPRVVAMVADAPLLGIGPGQFSSRAPAYNFARDEDAVRYGRSFRTAHSYPLLVAAENGLPALLALLLAATWTVVTARGRWRLQAGASRSLAAAAATGLAMLAVMSLFDEPLARPPVLFTAALLVALALPALASPRRLSTAWRTFAVVLLAALALPLVVQPTRAQALALQAGRTADPVARLDLLHEARRLLPGQLHYTLGEAELLLDHAAHPLDLKSYARIRVAADRAVQLDSSHAAAHLVRARLDRRACIELLRTEAACARAAASYQLALQQAPLDARLHREAASFAALRGRLTEAAAALQRAVALEPAFIGAWLDLMRVQQLQAVPASELETTRAGLEGARRRSDGVEPDSGYARDILRSESASRARLVAGGGV